MNVTIPPELTDLRVIEARAFPDARGRFLELYNAGRYGAAGLSMPFVQDNVSFSHGHVLRGLHFQHPFGQGKLVTVLQGEVFDVAVDVRTGSPTFGQWAGFTLSADNLRQLWIPEGFAHGFAVTGESALLMYKVTEAYMPAAERTIRWDDPALGITWPLTSPILAPKDAQAPVLADIDSAELPRWEGPNA